MPELLGRLQSALSDRYRLDREIGAGGMATVYLAEDVRHDRRVALKVLRPELAAVIGAERFLAEIKLTANLQHPHILPLFDSGEADGYLFYVMPFVEGETLRDRMTREKQLPVADALRITTEVASALDYAHRHGVVHRDIKPENILLHDGQALVADFGIALAASKASGARMTETGMSLGTPHYMSPEQAMGEREITARSDVYALGAVLYEMLTGDPPFTGSTAQAVVARVVTESPRPLVPQRHTIPPHVEAAVLTALEKLPADRFASAAEFAEALAGQDLSVDGGDGGDCRRARGRTGARAHGRTGVWAGGGARPRAGRGALGLVPAPAGAAAHAVQPGLRTNQTLQAPLATGGARIALSRRRAVAGLQRPRRGREPPLDPPVRPARRDADRRDRGGRDALLLSRRPAGRLREGRNGDPHRLTRRRAHRHAERKGQHHRRRLGRVTATSTSRWTRGIGRMRATGGDIEPVYTIKPDKKEIATEWPEVLPGNTGVIFRVRHIGQGVVRLRDHGRALAAQAPRTGPHPGPRRLRHLRPERPPAGRHQPTGS